MPFSLCPLPDPSSLIPWKQPVLQPVITGADMLRAWPVSQSPPRLRIEAGQGGGEETDVEKTQGVMGLCRGGNADTHAPPRSSCACVTVCVSEWRRQRE